MAQLAIPDDCQLLQLLHTDLSPTSPSSVLVFIVFYIGAASVSWHVAGLRVRKLTCISLDIS
jgi:hypothetical protein